MRTQLSAARKILIAWTSSSGARAFGFGLRSCKCAAKALPDVCRSLLARSISPASCFAHAAQPYQTSFGLRSDVLLSHITNDTGDILFSAREAERRCRWK